jgi:hypothetical protein
MISEQQSLDSLSGLQTLHEILSVISKLQTYEFVIISRTDFLRVR